jgi:hypothetical protein
MFSPPKVQSKVASFLKHRPMKVGNGSKAPDILITSAYDLFNDAITSSDYIALKGRMTDELEGHNFEMLFLHSPGGT